MNKSDLIKRVAEQLDLPQVLVKKIVQQFLGEIQTTLAKGEKVTMTGFGRFIAKKTPPRIRRNPKTGAKVKVPETVSIRFNASRKAKTVLSNEFENRT